MEQVASRAMKWNQQQKASGNVQRQASRPGDDEAYDLLGHRLFGSIGCHGVSGLPRNRSNVVLIERSIKALYRIMQRIR
jgi:hypothetical protein